MKSLLLVLAVLLLLAGSASVFAAADCGCTFQVNTPNRSQTLGGNAGTASHGGLHTAANNSGVVEHVPAGRS